MNYDLFGKVMELVVTDPYYEQETVWMQRNAVYYAVKNDKCLGYEVDGEFVGNGS